ncbi:MAG: BamA/TamA family outer membrane protein [Fusobacterium sp.]|nr:BamA/TamA family outer membrane protein [Fusobacterium sp.]
MNNSILKDFFKLMLSVTMVTLSVNSAFAAYNPNGFSLQQETGLNQLHDASNLETRRYENYVRQDYEQRYTEPMPAVEDNRDYNNNSMNAGVSQIQTDNSVYVGSVSVDPSEILSSDEINAIISQIQGRNVTIGEIQQAVNEINKLYASRGFVTARAYLPEQTITGGNIRIGLIESKVGNLTVNGNRWTRTKYITDRVGQKQDNVFDIVELEKDVVSFNRYNEGVSLKANLKAGQAPGTTDIEINAEEKLPFHVVGVMDNAGRYSTGHIRGGAMIYADSLFKNRDKLSIGSYFSGGATSPFVDYNVPVNKKDGRVGFLYTSTFAKLKYGDFRALDIRSRGYQYSLYYSQPLVRRPDLELKSYAAINYKRARISYLDDLFHTTDQVTSAELALNLRKDTKHGIWYLNQSAYYAFPILDKASNYFKYSGSITRLHDFSHGIIGQVRSNYQIIPQNRYVPYLDQIQSGGLFTVRGYNEGIMIGKNGYFLSGELIFPIMPSTIRTSKREVPFLGRAVKGAVFFDHAGIFPRRAEDRFDGSYFLASIGMGLRVQLPGSLTGRLYWGYPLINNAYEADRKFGRFHFELTLAPDLDALLNKRSTKEQVVVEEKHVEAKPAPAPEPVNNYPDVRHYDYFFDVPGAAL